MLTAPLGFSFRSRCSPRRWGQRRLPLDLRPNPVRVMVAFLRDEGPADCGDAG